MKYLTWDMIGLGGRGEIKYGLKRLHSAPLHADVGSYSGSSSQFSYRLRVRKLFRRLL